MRRRNFLFAGGALLFCPLWQTACSGKNTGGGKSRVIIARDDRLQADGESMDERRLAALLDRAVQGYFDRDNALEAWRLLVRPDEIIGLKVNCLSGPGSTHTALVDIICERLREAGLKPANIVIWDRLNRDLESAGFKLNTSNNGIRCFGNDSIGFDSRLETFGAAGSLVSKTISRLCDGIINLPVLRDHSIAGVTISLKNLFGAIHNPNKYHLSTGNPYIADVNRLPSISGKVRLTICDAISAQYEGGPSFMPHWRWPFNGLMVGEDRVALDYTGWQIIEQKRADMGLPTLKAAGREPLYIATAADSKHQLGTNDPAQIETNFI